MAATFASEHADASHQFAVFDEGDRDRFIASFGERAFLFHHRLTDNPLFSLPRLAHAAQRLIDTGHGNHFSIRAGAHRVDTSYSRVKARSQSLAIFEELEGADSFVKLTNLGEVDPDYAEISRAVVADTEALLGHSALGGVTMVDLTLFIASPRVVTPYHIDHDANFLCQISGEKDVYLFDPNDRELLTTDEIERFYIGDRDAARYRETMQARSACFHIAPGLGVHHPPLAPHWVRNGPNVSISVSIHMCTRDLDRRAHVYQANRILRKAKLHPRPPEQSALLDSIKAAGIELLGKSHPATSTEILYSGVDRMVNGMKRVRAMTSVARRAPPG